MSAPQRPSDESPRSRILRHDGESLSDAELVAVLLRGGSGGRSALEIGNELVAEHGNLRRLLRASGQVRGRTGISLAKSATLAAVFEIACRVARANLERRRLLDQPERIVEYIALRYPKPDQEILGALILDVRNRLITDLELFAGTLRRASVEPRAILRTALQRSASGIILWHTHPSGDPSPSSEDLQFTCRWPRLVRSWVWISSTT